MSPLFPAHIGKTEAVRLLAEANGMPDVNPWSEKVGESLDLLVKQTGAAEAVPIQWLLGGEGLATEATIFGPYVRRLGSPLHLSGRPQCFPPVGVEGAFTPELKTLSIPEGVVWNFAESPVILASSGDAIYRDYSSRYSPLVHFYEAKAADAIGDAVYVDGTAIVLFDDIRPLNFCHWLIDWLPRLAVLGARATQSDCYVITTPLIQQFQIDSLLMCGFDRSRIIEVTNFQAVRARQLLVTSDLPKPAHPALKAAPWCLSYLQSTIGLKSVLSTRAVAAEWSPKLYISRADAPGRRIANEDALFDRLRPLGYMKIVLSKLSLAEQAALFAQASHVVGLHGAGLSHTAFMINKSNVIEIFPSTYGTPAFYVLTAGVGNTYASYICSNINANSRTQLDDITIDIGDFLDRSKDLL